MDNIIIGYAASEKLEGNAWADLVNAVCGREEGDAKTFLRTQEVAFKEEYGPIPNAYRSAKSVVLGALKHGVSLIGDNGQSKGKTQVQTEIKQAKIPVEKDVVQQVDKHMHQVVQLYRSASHEERMQVFDVVNAHLAALSGE